MDFKQGENITLNIEVKDSTNTNVVLSGASAISVEIYIKESKQITYSTGITCSTDLAISSISGSTINIDLDRTVTKLFCVGDVVAKILVKENNIVKEYSTEIGTCYKGYSKDKTI